MILRHVWTAERIEILTLMWNDGFPASRIAAHLGDTTRNAVIGKVHRLRLPRHKRPCQPRAAIVDRRVYEAKARARCVSLPKPVKLPPPPPPKPWDGPPINIIDDKLTRFMCREIVSGRGPDTMFCGGPTAPGGQFSYCAFHALKNLSVQTRRTGHRTTYRPHRVAA